MVHDLCQNHLKSQFLVELTAIQAEADFAFGASRFLDLEYGTPNIIKSASGQCLFFTFCQDR